MKEGQILEKMKIKKNEEEIEVVFRLPKKSDTKKLMKCINSLVEERAMIAQMKKVTLTEEKEYLKKMLSNIKEGKEILVVVESQDKIIGSSSLSLGKKGLVHEHVAGFGIVLIKGYRGLGIGKKLMDLMINLARKKLNAEILTLSVFEKNKNAKQLYKDLGFKIYGKLPRSIKARNRYDTEIMMYKVLR